MSTCREENFSRSRCARSPCELCISGINISDSRTLSHNTPLLSFSERNVYCQSRHALYSVNNYNIKKSKSNKYINRNREEAMLSAPMAHAKYISTLIKNLYIMQLDEMHTRSQLQESQGDERLQLTETFYNLIISSFIKPSRSQSAIVKPGADSCTTFLGHQTCTHNQNVNLCNTNKANTLINEQTLTEPSTIIRKSDSTKVQRPATTNFKTREQYSETLLESLSRKGRCKNLSLATSPKTLTETTPTASSSSKFLSSSSELPSLNVLQAETNVHTKQYARPSTAYVRDSELLRALHNAENCLIALQSSHDNIAAEKATAVPRVPFRCLSAQL